MNSKEPEKQCHSFRRDAVNALPDILKELAAIAEQQGLIEVTD